MDSQRTEELLGQWKHSVGYCNDGYMSFIHLFKPIERTKPRINPEVNYGLWVITMYQHIFINCNKCTTLVSDRMRESSVPSTQF